MGSISDDLVALVDEGLGNSAYLLDLGDGRALVVDPPRDLRALRDAATRRGLRIAYAADTHLHADFLSGALQLATDDQATILASAAGMRAFDHRGLSDGDEVDLGGLTLRALATPGHTDEHLSFLLLDGSTPVGVFTGGSLIVGAAARTDLLGTDRTIDLAYAQYRSLHRLATLPDATAVWPTHGAGSFCSAPPGAARTSTIGAEKATNPLLAAPDAEAFVRALTDRLGTYPTYFAWLAEVNRRGPEVLTGQPPLPGLTVEQVQAQLRDGAMVVDVRPVADVAAGHIPGAISIALRSAFATWLGWVIDPATPIVIVRNPDQPTADILWPALNIGYGHITGELAGAMPAWAAAGLPVTTMSIVSPAEIGGKVLDIRQNAEYQAGHLPTALHIELGSLAGHAGGIESGPVTVMCAHGERAMTAATLLQRDGRTNVAVLDGGAQDWARTTGHQLEESA
jgi:glyoxylase-like metal-dependent hydrolase (beta-lactamase superfamily II)/rhodanese-related sulfurtransferase